MGFFGRLFAGPGPTDDFWYRSLGAGGVSLTGLRVDPDTALKLSAVWACVRIISESISSLPLPIYRVRPDGGKEKAPDHVLYDVLQYQPNGWQTAQAWRQQMTTHALLRGSGFSEMIAGPRGPHTALVPLNPDWLTVPARDDQAYVYREPGKTERKIVYEDLFRLDGLSLDGMRPCSVLEYARESMGLGLAAEQYAARVYSQDGRPRGAIQVDGKLSKEGAERLSEQWQQSYAGLGNAHKVAVLVEGAKFAPISVSPEDAQMIASREFSVEDICRWFGVPPHMVGSTAKVTSWGSGIEQLSIGFVTFTLLPWLKRWEQSIRRDLIFQKDLYFAEHVVDGLLRGDQESRYRAYMIGLTGTFLSPNDVRRMENMNPRSGGDVYQNPAITVSPSQALDDGASYGAHDQTADLLAAITGRMNGHAE